MHLWTIVPFALLAASQARSRVGGPRTESALCRGAGVVVVGKVGPNRIGLPGATTAVRVPIEVERIVYVDESRPGGDLLADLTIAELGDQREAYTPGARHILVLQYVDWVDELPPQWFRVYSRPIPAGSEAPPLRDLQYYWALHCAAILDNVKPMEAGWWTWWHDDPFRTHGCSHE